MKKETVYGILVLAVMFTVTSFTLASGFMTKVAFGKPSIWLWTAFLIIGVIIHIIAIKQLVFPIIWHSQQPKTQKQADRDRPYYRLLLELAFLYLAFSIAFAGGWIYILYKPGPGISWICWGLAMNFIPLGLMVIDGIRLLSGK